MERKTKSPKRKWVAVAVPTKRRKTPRGYVAATQNPRVPRGLARGQNPLPFKSITKLAYNQQITLTGGSAGAIAVKVFNAASLFDPDYSGTGHQPLGFDQIMPMYDHYVVLGSKMTVRFANAGTAAAILGVSGNAVVTLKTSASHYIEAGATSHMVSSLNNTGGNPVVSQGYSPKIHLGIDDPIAADKLQGTISANPTDGWFYHVFAEPINASETASAYADVTIVYTCAFIEPVQLAQS